MAFNYSLNGKCCVWCNLESIQRSGRDVKVFEGEGETKYAIRIFLFLYQMYFEVSTVSVFQNNENFDSERIFGRFFKKRRTPRTRRRTRMTAMTMPAVAPVESPGS